MARVVSTGKVDDGGRKVGDAQVRLRGVEVDDRAAVVHRGEDGVEALGADEVGADAAREQDSVHAQLIEGAAELGGCGVGVDEGEGGESAEAVWPALRHAGEVVVGGAVEGDGGGGVAHVGDEDGGGEHGGGDAARVHGGHRGLGGPGAGHGDADLRGRLGDLGRGHVMVYVDEAVHGGPSRSCVAAIVGEAGPAGSGGRFW